MGFSGNTTAIDNDTIKQNIQGQLYADEEVLTIPVRIIQAQQSMAIVKLQATASVPDFDYEGLFCDTMSDTTGYNDTIDTDGTTANYNTVSKKYENKAQVTATTETYSNGTGQTGATSTVSTSIVVNKASILSSVTWRAYYAGTTTVSIKDSEANVLATKGITTVLNGVVTLAFAITDYSRALIIGETITLNFSNNLYYQDSRSYDGTIFDITSQRVPANNLTGGSNIVFTECEYVTQKIKVNFPTVTGTVTSVMLVTNKPNFETGSSVNFNITDGTDTMTGLEENEKNTLTLTDNPTFAEINLIPKATAPNPSNPSIQDYCFVIWTV